MIVCMPLAPSHHADIFALGAQLFREEDVPEIGNALATACAPSTVLLGPGNTLAGFALFCQGQCISTKTSPRHPLFVNLFGNLKKCYELAFFAIDPRYQGAGLGSKLLAHCLGQLPSEAVCWLVVEVGTNVAPRLYAKYDFQCLHAIADANPVPLDLWVRIPKFDHASNSPLCPASIFGTCPSNVASFFTMTTYDSPLTLAMST
jgi:ribosomal protein S18 acetylase RimI-like enzyme